MKSDIHYRYWTAENRRALEKAGTSLPKMAEIALNVISRMPPGLHMVSGPMTTGGLGNAKDNLTVFTLGVEWLFETEKLNVFSQMPFEIGMLEYHKEWKKTCKPDDYCWPILHEFYARIFETKRFEMMHFLHGYEESVGAKWEHDQCEVHGVRRRYLPRELSLELIAAAGVLPAAVPLIA
jgi:hypothetical protein